MGDGGEMVVWNVGEMVLGTDLDGGGDLVAAGGGLPQVLVAGVVGDGCRLVEDMDSTSKLVDDASRQVADSDRRNKNKI